MVLLKKRSIIPVFVPHMGCPFNCIFCNQTSISGQYYPIDSSKMKTLVENHLNTIKKGNIIEIAFYGGSFTGIPESVQEELLETGYDYIKAGSVNSIRLSTRPDFIDETVLKRLQKYKVSLIELGVQSLDDEVLKKSGRGHTSEDVYRAIEIIRNSGIKVGIQTMIGLPGDTEEKDLETAQKVIDLFPETVRIYPTLVIRGTPLEEMTKRGQYKPLTLDEAVRICAKLLDIYSQNNINVIRIGLQPTEDISFSGDVVAGPFHPSFRQLVETALMKERLEREIIKKGMQGPGTLIVQTSPRNISNITGYDRQNKKYLCSKFGFSGIKVIESRQMSRYEFRINDTK